MFFQVNKLPVKLATLGFLMVSAGIFTMSIGKENNDSSFMRVGAILTYATGLPLAALGAWMYAHSKPDQDHMASFGNNGR